LPYTEVNFSGRLRLYLLELVPHHSDLIVYYSKQFVSFYSQLLIKVRPGLPYVELNSTLKEKIKAAMVKRYDGNLKAVDLSRFHTDPAERMVVYNTHTMLIHTVYAVICISYENSGQSETAAILRFRM
jgi:hypothetical protein